MPINGYETTREVSERTGKHVSEISRLIKQGRFPGAKKLAGPTSTWLIPEGSTPLSPQEAPSESIQEARAEWREKARVQREKVSQQ